MLSGERGSADALVAPKLMNTAAKACTPALDAHNRFDYQAERMATLLRNNKKWLPGNPDSHYFFRSKTRS